MDFRTHGWEPQRIGSSTDLPLASNVLLKQLASADRSLLEQHAELRRVSIGTVLFEVGEPVGHVYFPLDTIVALQQARRIEVAVAGREGVLGWTAVAGLPCSPFRAIVRCRPGQLLKVPIEPLLDLSRSNPSFRSMLAQYMVVTAVQISEGLGAHSHHRLDAAIARWLLMRHDRVGGDWISAQHQEIAESLGARRASVTDCLHILEGELHIRCRRNRILVRSRADLEARATGAYGQAEALYRASIGAFGKSLSNSNAIAPPLEPA